MPLVDRGVDMLSKSQLHSNLGDVLVPLEFAVIVIVPILLAITTFKVKCYRILPDNLFQVILIMHWLYAVVLGPLRWLPGNAVFEYVSNPTTEEGCMASVWLDTFCQLCIVFTNTAIVASVFYMVYFRTLLTEKTGAFITTWFLRLGFVVACGLSTVTMFGDAHNYVGWCTADSVNAILKLVSYFLALVIQITMIIPTLYMTYDENTHKGSKKTVSTGFFIRFLSAFCTQFVGLFPVIAVEFLGLARKPVPSIMMWVMIIFLPLSQLWDCLIYSLKIWPSFCSDCGDTANAVMPCIPWMIELKEEEDAKMHYLEEEKEEENKDKKNKKKKKKK